MIAYAIYKRSKREWCIATNPTDQEKAGFAATVTATQLEAYRTQAQAQLVAFAETAIQESANSFKQEGAESAIVAEVKRQNSFWLNLLCNGLASVVFAVLLYLFGLIYISPGPQQFVDQTKRLTEARPSQ